MRSVLGALLIAIPFIALAVVSVNFVGWLQTIGIFVITGVTVAIISAGVWLLT